MNKGSLITFYSCKVYSLNLIIELRMSDFISCSGTFFFMVVKCIYIKFALLAIFRCVVQRHFKYIHIVCSHHHHPSPELFHLPKVKL